MAPLSEHDAIKTEYIEELRPIEEMSAAGEQEKTPGTNIILQIFETCFGFCV